MKGVKLTAAILLVLASLAALGANYIAPAGYEHQFRESPGASPSAQHPLGTDDLGRDRFARLLYGTRISLVLAPLAAAITTLLAAFVGGIAGYFGGWVERCLLIVMDLFLSVPWLFLLITARASHTNSDFSKSLVPAQMIRAEAAHPSKPNSIKVTPTEASGEIFSGSMARTVMSRKSHGTERNRSITISRQRSTQPPKYPAIPPTKAASNVVMAAASGARTSEMRVP